MTPSINRLASAAEALGAYIIDAEYIMVRDDFSPKRTPDLGTFKEWVTNFQYYNAVICVHSGQIDNIDAQLESDYDELTALLGC
jgi:hypothetical protein